MLPAPSSGATEVAADHRRWVTPEPLNVAPEVVGLPLAPPLLRACAMGVDLVAVALLSSLPGIFLAAGLLAVVFALGRPLDQPGPWRRAAAAALALLFVVLAVHAGWKTWHEPRSARAARASAAEAASAVGRGLPEAERIVLLEAALADALRPRPVPLQNQLEDSLDELGETFGWGIVYFSLLPAFWGGQTLGKRLFHLRVLEIAGRPMTVLRSLKRYGGYAAGMATGGLGFAQLLWDANRQAIQDRAAHTVVVDTRAPRRDQAASS